MKVYTVTYMRIENGAKIKHHTLIWAQNKKSVIKHLKTDKLKTDIKVIPENK